ncbi:MAG TPA: hypothetical protein VJ826_04450 [Candidatus Polarisedimenticolaceae bacterium]|nr:hypothetical protein [Candidatus Polarisedimenticolaceae bacterium]
MRYPNAQQTMRVGDVVSIGNGKGVVVACIDTAEYSAEHPREQWSYLLGGVMIDTDFGGLVHYPDQDAVDEEGIVLVAPKSA